MYDMLSVGCDDDGGCRLVVAEALVAEAMVEAGATEVVVGVVVEEAGVGNGRCGGAADIVFIDMLSNASGAEEIGAIPSERDDSRVVDPLPNKSMSANESVMLLLEARPTETSSTLALLLLSSPCRCPLRWRASERRRRTEGAA